MALSEEPVREKAAHADDGGEQGSVGCRDPGSEEGSAEAPEEEPTEEPEAYDCGSTAVAVMIYGAPGALQVTAGWAGDSRAVLCRGGVAVDLSDDHKPEDEIELKRINAAGSMVSPDGRVDGNLNL